MKGLLQRYLLPGVVFQSVLVGGAYATGREIVQYGGRFGAGGIWAIAAIAAGFSVLSAVCYEYARVTRQFEYRGLVRSLVGPLWPLFDLLYAVMVVVVIAVVSAATGSLAQVVLGIPYALGVAGIIVLVALINAAGRTTIETFKSLGSALLYAGYAVFAGSVLSGSWSRVGEVLSGSVSAADAPAAAPASILLTGLLYVGYNLVALPSTLFVLDRQETRRQALVAGLVTGVLSTVPFILTWLAILAFWPDPAVLDAEVPWLVMLGRVGGDGLIAFYAVVVLWTLVETSVGLIHAVTERLSAARVEAGGASLGPREAGAVTAIVLIAAAVLSRLGIIALVARGYSLMAYGFLALFALPLLTLGVARILRAPARDASGSLSARDPRTGTRR